MADWLGVAFDFVGAVTLRAGASNDKRCLVDEWFGVNCLVESESKGGRLVVGWVWLLILLELLP